MDYLSSLFARNEEFVENGFKPGLKMLPTSRSLIVGCLDTRVDPMALFKLEPGEIAVYRNVGGRVSPAFLETMGLLRSINKAVGVSVGPGAHIIVLQHTDCGINHCYRQAPGLLAQHLGVPTEALDSLFITDPYKAVAYDIETLKNNISVAGDYTISGLVYDVATGEVTTVVPPTPLLAAEEVR